MPIENVMMTVNRLPEMRAVIDTGTDWVNLGGFLLTVLAVALGSIVTIITFKRTVRSQEGLARAVAIKDSRQTWINDLRMTCAEYVAAIDVLQYQTDKKKIYQIFVDKVTKEDPSKAAELVASWELESRRVKQAALALKARIELLSNPNEANFKELVELTNEAINRTEKLDGDSETTCEAIIAKAQIILKAEWNRAKNME